MPLYDYDCAACGRRFEVIHGVNADPPAACPLCGSGPVKKAISAAAVHYKGSGWAKKERHAAVKSGSASRSGDAGSSDGGSSSDSGSPSESGTSDSGSSDSGDAPAPAAAKAGDASTGPHKPSKPGASSKAPSKASD